MSHEIVAIPGDGIGREVVPAAVRVLDATGVELTVREAAAGDEVQDERGTPLPAETADKVREADATLFGAAGETAADVVLPLRSAVKSFANVRPARAYPGVDAVAPDTDLVVVRENTEGVYAGIESEITEGVTTLTRVITTEASRRIAEFGFELAAERGADVTVAHKANVMRTTDGTFLEAVRSVAEDRGDVAGPTADSEAPTDYEEVLMDALAMHLVLRPEEFDVLLCPNLAGDLLSDLAAGLVGGLGLLPSANVGSDNAMFEPVHGSAPDIAGQGIANPVATVLSGAHLLEWLGEPRPGARVRDAVKATLRNGPHTPDLGGTGTTTEMTDAIIDRL